MEAAQRLLIKNARLTDPSSGTDAVSDLFVASGKVERVAECIDEPSLVRPGSALTVIDGTGLWLWPGLVDVHVHFREPGQEYKEDIRSGSWAAAAGGFTTVVAEPNTIPPIDTPRRVRRLLEVAQEKSIVNFYTKSTMTIGMKGAKLADIVKLKEAGAIAVSDDGHPVPGPKLMEHALRKATECKILVNPHCEESAMYRERIVAQHEKKPQKRLWVCMPYGQPGASYTSEDGFIKRDVELAEKAGARIHISHVSLARSVRIIAAARRRGVKVTAEATPHHFLLTADAEEEIGPNAKVNPPLRSEEDVAAVRQGLADGTIDIIASDHAPHSAEEKSRPWDDAPFGIIGLETTLGLVLTYLVRPGVLTLMQAIDKMTTTPARIFGLNATGVGSLAPGTTADLTMIDPDKTWKVDTREFYSKGRNCPFAGWELRGRASATFVAGRIVYSTADFARRVSLRKATGER